ncbi:putative ankyrin [Phytophthora infestans]|uniref:Putative ankyrin n=1 Tax=Phytophthora infestans TaxID=4787 RepID=A0A833SPX3_PHYIN|nr:putative ankyrin [Phytophthora infestans]
MTLCITRAMNNAPMAGQLGVIKWLPSNRSERCTQNVSDEAAAHGYFHSCMEGAMHGASNGDLKYEQRLDAYHD